MLLAIPYFSFTTFSIGPLTLHAWGLWVALGFLAGIALAVQTARRRGVNADAVFDLGFWIILGAMVFARLTYIVGDLSFYLSHPLEILRIWEGGLTIYGGYLGAAVATLLVMRWKHWRFWDHADVLAFALPLGIFIGRMGCFSIHDHPGKLTSVPWGISYFGAIRHETGLYDSINGLILFAFFWLVQRYPASKREGFYLGAFMVWYGTVRFLLDFLRATDLPESDLRWWGLTAAQYFSILMAIGGVLIFVVKRVFAPCASQPTDY
ncbi:MAG: prolipoprotein diacylglyceryl transferase [Patescibacteria group bacterium]|mgnify:CR=1 FL=1